MHHDAALGSAVVAAAAGNGTLCTATLDVGRIANSFVSSGTAQLACNEGSNVQYPPTGPGFRHDPTNYTDSGPSLKVLSAGFSPLSSPCFQDFMKIFALVVLITAPAMCLQSYPHGCPSSRGW